MRAVGTECVTASTVSSWSFSYENMKKVLLRRIGPADGAAEAVVVAGRLAGAEAIRRKEIGRSRIVAVVVRQHAVQSIRAALEREIHAAGACVADLRVVGGGLDLELLDRIGGRLNADARLRDDVARAVDRELAVQRAGHRRAAQVVVVHGPLQRVRALERGARHQARQAVGRAVTERNLADQLAGDHLPERGGAGLELRSFRRRPAPAR